MLKDKNLYRKYRKSRNKYTCKKTLRNHKIDLFSELPVHQSMKKIKNRYYNYNNYDNTPLSEFIKSKIGEDWNDVYSEILKKIKKNYKYLLESDLNYLIKRPIFNDDYIPLDNSFYRRGSICSDRLYVDLNNIICYKSKDEILSDSKKLVRKLKLQKIFDIEKENQSSD